MIQINKRAKTKKIQKQKKKKENKVNIYKSTFNTIKSIFVTIICFDRREHIYFIISFIKFIYFIVVLTRTFLI